jgi:hypothetical protein
LPRTYMLAECSHTYHGKVAVSFDCSVDVTVDGIVECKHTLHGR